MAVYELSEALLNTRPEIRIGDKLYRVDDRKKTVEQLSKLTEGEDTEKAMLELLLGKKAAKEIEDMNLPFPAYTELITLVGAAATGEDPEQVKARFQKALND